MTTIWNQPKEQDIEWSIKGMRLSHNSIDKMDSYYTLEDNMCFNVGTKDFKLMKSLILRGSSHCLFMRQITCMIDIIASREFWQQFATYRIGVERSSSSTMHTLTKSELTQDNFEDPIPECFLEEINKEIKNKNLKRAKQLLPESFLQRRMYKLSYQALRSIYLDRKNHKLGEWKTFIDSMKELRLSELIFLEKNKDE